MTMTSVWSRRSIHVFFALGFGLPWIGWTTNQLFDTQGILRTLLFYTGDFMSIAGIVATWAAGGGSAVRALFRRCFAPAGPGWWIAAFLLPLAWMIAARVTYGLSHGGIGAPSLGALSLFLSVPAWRAWTTGPLGEEFGWRGYFLPRLLTVYRPVVATLVLGVLWSIWHYPLYARSIFSTPPRASTFTISVLCFSILMTIFWFRTKGNLLIAILFHWAVNVSPSVATEMIPLPAVTQQDRGLELWTLLTLVVTTGIATALFGRWTLGSREDFVVERDLAEEKVLA
jgi:membrane protease YdiL (CAAX protease family)